jgi:hypothetical protein
MESVLGTFSEPDQRATSNRILLQCNQEESRHVCMLCGSLNRPARKMIDVEEGGFC